MQVPLCSFLSIFVTQHLQKCMDVHVALDDMMVICACCGSTSSEEGHQAQEQGFSFPISLNKATEVAKIVNSSKVQGA